MEKTRASRQLAEWLVSIFLGTSLGMWAVHKYSPAYLFLSVAGLCAIVAAQLSDCLTKRFGEWKVAEVSSGADTTRVVEAKRKFIFWNVCVSLLIASLLFGVLAWMRHDELAHEQDAVFGAPSRKVELPQSGISVSGTASADRIDARENHKSQAGWGSWTEERCVTFGVRRSIPVQPNAA